MSSGILERMDFGEAFQKIRASLNDRPRLSMARENGGERVMAATGIHCETVRDPYGREEWILRDYMDDIWTPRFVDLFADDWIVE